MITGQDAKRAYVESVLQSTNGKGVVVCPVFINEGTDQKPVWTATDTAVIEGANPDWCAINVMSIQESYSAAGFENQRVMSALIRRRIAGAEDKYVPGQVLNGKIAVMEQLTPTDAADDSRDVKYLGADLQEAGIACTVQGKPVYQRKYYTDNLGTQDIVVNHDNQEQIANHRALVKVQTAKPQSAGIKGAAARITSSRTLAGAKK